MGTILLVEDDADTVRTLSRILGTQHSVAAVNTGTDARLAIERLKPDLVLLDLSLPDTDGLLVEWTPCCVALHGIRN